MHVAPTFAVWSPSWLMAFEHRVWQAKHLDWQVKYSSGNQQKLYCVTIIVLFVSSKKEIVPGNDRCDVLLVISPENFSPKDWKVLKIRARLLGDLTWVSSTSLSISRPSLPNIFSSTLPPGSSSPLLTIDKYEHNQSFIFSGAPKPGLFFHQFLLNSRRFKLKVFSKLENFFLNSSKMEN